MSKKQSEAAHDEDARRRVRGGRRKVRRDVTGGSLAARIRRLEEAAGKGRRCAVCRLKLRTHLTGPAESQADCDELEDEAETRCHYCGWAHGVSLEDVPEDQREAARLYYTFTLEDIYTDPKAHALHLWVGRRPWKEPPMWRAAAYRGDPKSPGARLHLRLQGEAKRLTALKHKAMEARYGAPFPEHRRLLDSVEAQGRGGTYRGYEVKCLRGLARLETRLKLDAALERIVWGRRRPETAEMLRGATPPAR